MKFWLTPQYLFNCTNYHRSIPSHTLHCRHLHSLLLRRPHHPRRKLRMTHPQYSCQRSIIFLYLHLHTHCPRPLLRLLSLQRNLKHWSYPTSSRNNNRLRWLRLAMRTNVLLRRHSHHKPPLCHPLHWKHPCTMNLRGLLGR